MNALNLPVGLSLNLQILGDRSGNRIQAKILGYKLGESLIAEVPGAALLPISLRLGDEVVARCLVGRHMLGFKCTVLRVCISPYLYFHLTYPSQVEHTEVRQAERVVVAIPVQVITPVGEACEAEIRDISAAGAMLAASRSLGEVGEAVKLCFDLSFAQVARTLALAAVIRNVTPVQNGPHYRTGVQFKDMAEEDMLFLLSSVYEQSWRTPR